MKEPLCNEKEVEACERDGPFCPMLKEADSDCPRVQNLGESETLTDIWGEKPTLNIGVDAFDSEYRWYSGVDMDAWLVNLKVKYEAMESQITLLKLDIEALDKENRILQNIGDTAEGS